MYMLRTSVHANVSVFISMAGEKIHMNVTKLHLQEFFCLYDQISPKVNIAWNFHFNWAFVAKYCKNSNKCPGIY